MALHVSSIAQLKTLAKLKHKKERDKFPKLSDAQEALAQELRYRDWFHALQVLSQNQEPDRHLELVAAANKIVSVLNKKFAGRYSPARVGTPEDAKSSGYTGVAVEWEGPFYWAISVGGDILMERDLKIWKRGEHPLQAQTRPSNPWFAKFYDINVKMLESKKNIEYDLPEWLHTETIDGSQLLLSDES